MIDPTYRDDPRLWAGHPLIDEAEAALRALGAVTLADARDALRMLTYSAELSDRERGALLDRFAPTLVITRGLPGSGKSTWARAWVATDPARRARVNRDDIRAMLRRGPWPHGDVDAEAMVSVIQHAAVSALLSHGYDVIMDDTHLTAERVAEAVALAATAGARLEIVSLLDVPIEICIARDLARSQPAPDDARPEPVGADRIRQMWAEHQAEASPR